MRDRIAQIPVGKVATYGQIAASLGDRLASRWIGEQLLHGPAAQQPAAHRVVRAGGELGLFHTGDPTDKQRLLESEGVVVVDGKVNLAEYEFCEFAGTAPLADLRKWQQELAERNRLSEMKRGPALVAGLDVSYDGDDGVVAYVLFDYATREMVWSHITRQPVLFPYITSYLSYRELPLHLSVLATAMQASRIADLLMIDGSGILHPRRSGIASMLSALTGLPTIGVTKKHLCGSYLASDLSADRFCDLHVEEKAGPTKLGAAILPTRKTKRPIFVSPGGLVSCDQAEALVSHFMVGKRLPTPIAAADRLSRQSITTG
ncbi:endonuclease V [Blastopirellula sp. JC732]|uniref:Endonuclease V n=1 Tax=Blastopirellula sediminis TaxID=2894196 RepID=A0A9X1MJX2_9BACT|nr:endonuclease V [Blastopirellula sediminis]MCC9609669.1 endonuclease V [Blastopirellula sediminis]MCC9627555.1 endonuclease V [Blastopirellula sediminis]